VLARRIAPFLKANPGIEAGFTFSHELLKPLLADDLDVIIDSKTHIRDDLVRALLFRERYVLVAAPSLIDEYQISELSDLERIPWLTTDVAGKWWQRLLVQLSDDTRLNPHRFVSVNHLRGMVQLAVSGIGIGLVPAYCVLNEVRAGLLRLLFQELQISEDRFYLYCRQQRCDNLKIQAFLAFMQTLKPEELGEISY
jgi:DNA-binding transcriptional LysR family regulator